MPLAYAASSGRAASASAPASDFATALAIAALVIMCLAVLAAVTIGLHRRAGRAAADVGRLEALVDVLDEGIVVCSGMQIVAVNKSLCRMLEVSVEQMHDSMLSTFVRDADAIYRLLSTDDVRMEVTLHSATGAKIIAEVTARNFHYGGAQHRLLEMRDVHEQHETQERVSFLAHHDSLTKLPNREVLRSRLEDALARAKATGERCAAIWIDLDRFKEANDVHGHVTGDAVLRAVTDKLQYELPAGTLIVRIGGDEFVVLCENITDPREARLTGQQLRRLLNRPFTVGNVTLTVGASVGLAVFPDDASSSDELLRNADLALNQAKSEGRARCRHFTEALGKDRLRRAALSEQLPAAIANGEIQAFFQPLVSATSLRATGFEALARWFHPEFGSVPPNEFIRVAEETSQIVAVTDTIMRQALAAASHWPPDTRVSVNVSPLQINSDLVDQVRALIQSTGFDPRRLELEVTEDVLINDFEQAASMFARLRGLGVQVAMDDFGSGYTSLGNLRRLNFERIKIDRIFTNDLPNHRRTAAIVRSIFVLARELDLHVTVEGVETAEQFAFLRHEGCSEVQGFLFSPPKPLAHWTDPVSFQFPPIVAAVEAPLAPDNLIEIKRHLSKRKS